MAGIYIHVPFCKKACHYCNFHFSTSLHLKSNFVAALLHEMALTSTGDKGGQGYLGNQVIETVYLGGGTPSLLDREELNLVFSGLHQNFDIDTAAEITLEANPDDISAEKLREWKAVGINRLSIGVQSFFDEHLLWMNRAHSSQQSLTAIQLAMAEGFHNISIDLIYGVPGMSNSQWMTNLDQANYLGVAHLSSYALTVEPATALYKMIQQKKKNDVDEGLQSEQFSILANWAESAGYEQYEISNLAKPGMRSRHNSSYWQGRHYLGLGPSAHSFNGISRQWNIANNVQYIRSVMDNKLPIETELLSPVQQFNEYIMTSLRTVEGINMHHVERQFGIGSVNHIRGLTGKFIKAGRIRYDDEFVILTTSGKFFADGIAAELFK